MHKSQLFFWLLAGFLVGVFAASFLNFNQVFIYVGLITAIGLIGVFGYNKGFNKNMLLAGFIVLALLFGVIRFNSADFGKDSIDVFVDLKAGQKNIEVVVNGYIDNEPVVKGDKAELVLRAKELISGNKTIRINDKILITTNSFPRFNYGDMISVKGALQKPNNFTPSTSSGRADFDYVTYLKKEGIRTTMFYPDISTSPELKLGRVEKLKIRTYRTIFAAKSNFELSVSKTVSEPKASFINGILLGSRQNISDEINNAFNETGTTHVLAISGYNIMIISWAVLMGLVYFFRRRIVFWLSVAVIIMFFRQRIWPDL